MTDFLTRIQPYSMSSIDSLRMLYELSKTIRDNKVQGDIVECGVYNGGSGAALALPHIDDRERKLWLYDSFEGMPATTDIDGEKAKEYIGKCIGNEEKVRNILSHIKFPQRQVNIRKGWFSKTLNNELPERIALLHIDADWYDSVTICLDKLYEKVSIGGLIILDDYGHWEGCREAFYDFIHKKNIKPLIERFGHTQMYWVKGKENNRPFSGVKNSFFV